MTSKLINIQGTEFHFTLDWCEDCLFRYFDSEELKIACVLDSKEISDPHFVRFPDDCPLPDAKPKQAAQWNGERWEMIG
jgi:hypothetical protein